MKTSESIAKLAAALATAQTQIKPAAMDATNPFFKSRYATLNSVWDACRGALTANGLSVIQAPATSDEGRLKLVTRICHVSGEWVESELALTPTKDDIQGVGSALTYARRYMLGAMVGVVTDEDNDAEPDRKQAGQPQQRPQPQRQAKAPAKSQPKQAATEKAGKTMPARIAAGFDFTPEAYDLSQVIPHYAKKDGQANMYHITTAAALCGFSEINADNAGLVIEAIAERYYREHGSAMPEQAAIPAADDELEQTFQRHNYSQ